MIKKQRLFVLIIMCCLFILCSQPAHLRVMAQTAGITGDDTIDQSQTGIPYTVSLQNDSGGSLTDLVVTATLDLPGFSYVSGTTNINVDGGAAFCTANPTPSGTESFQKELSSYKSGKGSVRFPLDKPIPYGLVRKIVRFRVKENLKSALQKGTLP